MTSAWTRALPGDAILEREAGTGSGWISLPVTFPPAKRDPSEFGRAPGPAGTSLGHHVDPYAAF